MKTTIAINSDRVHVVVDGIVNQTIMFSQKTNDHEAIGAAVSTAMRLNGGQPVKVEIK